jgi:hypothetical protein
MHSLTINHNFCDMWKCSINHTPLQCISYVDLRGRMINNFTVCQIWKWTKSYFSLTWTWQFLTSFFSLFHVVSESPGNLWFVLACNLLKGLVIYLVCVDPWGGHVSEKEVICCDVKYSNWKPSVRSVIWAVHLGLIHYHTKLNLLCYQLMMAGPQNHRTSHQIGM